ncbi:hypothetical protein YWIDRAFT_05917 [Streptomyces sp. SceaMP-e96]|nr:hypothetical protein YWIDRAFT_05917 [Streptomyces sp. SceaMP-e96]
MPARTNPAHKERTMRIGVYLAHPRPGSFNGLRRARREAAALLARPGSRDTVPTPN